MRSIATALALLAAVISGCSDINGLPTGRTFDNRTGVDITVAWQRQNGEQTPQVTVPRGETRYVGVNQFGNPSTVCGDGVLVVLGASGDELIRRPASCERWIIRLPAVPTAQITDRTWVLTGRAKPGESTLKPTTRATLVLRADGGMTVETGCRTLIGHWTTTADEVSPTDLLVAEGANSSDCPADLVDQDDQLSRIVSSGFAVHLEEDTLTATSNDPQHLDWQLVFGS